MSGDDNKVQPEGSFQWRFIASSLSICILVVTCFQNCQRPSRKSGATATVRIDSSWFLPTNAQILEEQNQNSAYSGKIYVNMSASPCIDSDGNETQVRNAIGVSDQGIELLVANCERIREKLTADRVFKTALAKVLIFDSELYEESLALNDQQMNLIPVSLDRKVLAICWNEVDSDHDTRFFRLQMYKSLVKGVAGLRLNFVMRSTPAPGRMEFDEFQNILIAPIGETGSQVLFFGEGVSSATGLVSQIQITLAKIAPTTLQESPPFEISSAEGIRLTDLPAIKCQYDKNF